MTELLREQMSAFLDDALARDESDVLLRRLGDDRELRRAFECYELIGAAMRGGALAPGLAERVRAALAEEPALSAGARRKSGALRPLAGAAIAASIAAAAIFGVQRLNEGRPPAQPLAQVTVPAAPAGETASYGVPQRGPRPASVLNAALLAEYAARHSGVATMPNPAIMNYRIVAVSQHPDVRPARGSGPEREETRRQ